MTRILLLLLILVEVTAASAQTSSEILLFDLKIKKNKVTLSNPKNISNHPGYDNQPGFNREEPIVYFSSFNEDGRSDIRAYNYEKNELSSLTQTQEREYSPTHTPDKGFISCIIQRDNGAQDLGKYPIDGGDPVVIIDNLIVGYHAWADNSHLALFVLGEPNTLHYMRLPTKEDTILAQNVGRSLHRIPGGGISFVHKISATDWQVKKLDSKTMTITTLAPTLPGREDLAWSPNGFILSSDGSKILVLNPAEKVWREIQITSGQELLKGVTRLAVSAKGDKLAVVVAE
jgi:hypothetical protein